MSASVLDKRMSVADIVGQLESGMNIGIGGWGARQKPSVLRRLRCWYASQ